VAVLDPDIVFHADAEAARLGGRAVLHGATSVAEFFNGRARVAVPGLIDGEVGVLVPVEGRMLFVLELTIRDGRITTMYAVADRDEIASLELEQLAWSA
jgi:RNA polymerase sigma-70 factor (ECF subfamily)